MKRILVILNPAANSTKARSLKQKIESLSRRAAVRLTSLPGEARNLAETAVQEGFSIVVAAGGDGTINEIANGLAGSKTVLGVLPVGTMNVFATELGIPGHDLAKAWEVIEGGCVVKIDLPQANNQHFVQLAGAGLDAEVVARTTTDFKNALGPMSYLLTLAQIAAHPPPKIKAQPAKGRVREGSFVLVGNGRFYGGPFVLFKEARMDDGLLDVIVFKNQSHWDLVRYFQAIAFGTHLDLPDVEYFQTPSLRLTSENGVPVEIDGEVRGTLPVRFKMSGLKLSVLIPAGKSGK